jgi:hypothetical protein
MVYDDDTGKPSNFEIDPPGPDGPSKVTPTRTAQQQIVDIARNNPGWSASQVASQVSANTSEKVTADLVTFVLRHAERDNRDRR